jgi:hypothetical protein
MDAKRIPKEGVTFYLPIALANDIRSFCYQQRLTMSEFAISALERAIKKAKIAAELKAKKAPK